MSRPQYTVHRSDRGWLILNNATHYAIARCDSRSDARSVAQALNNYAADEQRFLDSFKADEDRWDWQAPQQIAVGNDANNNNQKPTRSTQQP
jgi:hypothetical protein